MSNCAEYAVVVGASMSGLLSATVLAGYYKNVTAVERDVLPVGSENRRGGPQGTHVHVLMPSNRWRRYDKMRSTSRVCSSSGTRSAASTLFMAKA
jgi:2-polyprenyl-6-methoxyphenol hydroxylase-like FAD-dependent oxidoreductase